MTNETCPDCGKQYNPLCMGSVVYHSGPCKTGAPQKPKAAPWSKGKKDLWQQLCASERRNSEKDIEIASLRKRLSEALGRAECFGIGVSIKAG
jgi:hypothetical protein